MNGRSEMMQGIFTVESKTYLTPHYISIVLTGADIEHFKNATIGDNNKLVIPINGTKKVMLPEFGGKASETGSSDTIIRTYTLRNINLAKQQMTIDFVAHGENGPASAWAINAEPGDELGVLMKDKGKQLFEPANWYLLAGDHTALPVISVILETLDKDAHGEAFIEVPCQKDIQELKKPKHVKVTWIFNDTPGVNSALPERLKEIDYAAKGRKFIFAAAESKPIQLIQGFLRNLLHLDRSEWKAYSYWKFGLAEDESARERTEVAREQ